MAALMRLSRTWMVTLTDLGTMESNLEMRYKVKFHSRFWQNAVGGMRSRSYRSCDSYPQIGGCVLRMGNTPLAISATMSTVGIPMRPQVGEYINNL